MSGSGPPVFLFGPLRHPACLAKVAGEALPGAPAVLAEHTLRHAGDPVWPCLVAAPGASTRGRLVAPGPDARARLDFFGAVFGRAPAGVTVMTATGPAAAIVHQALGDAAASLPWSLGRWRVAHSAATAAAAGEVMDCFGRLPPAAVAARWPAIRQRAASTERATRSVTPVALRRGLGGADVSVAAHRRPYSEFFTVVEDDLRFRRFDGRWSDTVTRAAFVAGDAVTVLPYDRRLDAVLLVEQFRFGPHARGDRHPWVLEPVAGRVDPGEAPETTARRETLEEAGLALDRLELVARYYPSTGAFTEYVWSFVGLCRLEGFGGRTGGVAGEAEDILSHVIPFERLMAAVASGEAECAPLLLSAFWLAANRPRLRS